ncbi:hypothetical protein KCP78_18805 [Salmonella enterica subsp. enterica]|nr:hypothetical protein KCP78_18805 [Salmonella enterica subsp. enterica]
MRPTPQRQPLTVVASPTAYRQHGQHQRSGAFTGGIPGHCQRIATAAASDANQPERTRRTNGCYTVVGWHY